MEDREWMAGLCAGLADCQGASLPAQFDHRGEGRSHRVITLHLVDCMAEI